MTPHRQAEREARRAMETPALDEKALKRLREAWLEAVPERDLARRFGIPLAAVKDAAKGLSRGYVTGREP